MERPRDHRNLTRSHRDFTAAFDHVFDHSDHLMPRNYRRLERWKLAFDDMEVRAAYAAGVDSYKYFAIKRFGRSDVLISQRIRLDGPASWKNGRFHVRMRARKYRPASEKITSGDHAATFGGS